MNEDEAFSLASVYPHPQEDANAIVLRKKDGQVQGWIWGYGWEKTDPEKWINPAWITYDETWCEPEAEG